MPKQVKKAVIPAAGFGTRFLPQVKAMPKEMMPVVDKPIIQIVVEELVDAGIEDIVIVTGSHKRAIEDHFDIPDAGLVANLKQAGKTELLEQVRQISRMANFIYIRQKGPYGNGTPILNVESVINNEPFIYCWADDFIVATPSRAKQLITAYNEYQSTILGSIYADKDEDYLRYGYAGGKEIKPGSGVIQVEKIVEKPGKANAPSNLANVSGFLFTPDIFSYMKQAKAKLEEGKELYYNDALRLMIEDHLPIYAVELKQARYYDTGNKLEYLKTVVEFGLKHPDIAQGFKSFLRTLPL